MIRNPIIHKEVLSALRTRKAILMQSLFLLVLAILLWQEWPAGGMQNILQGKDSQAILSIIALGELVMVALFAPAFTAASLTGEKERQTFESLFATAMRPWEIAVGKMIGSLGFILLLVLSGVPALAATLLLGGTGAEKIIAIVAVLLLTAVYLGMIGMLVSTVMHRSYRAIIVTYAVILMVFFLLALPAWPLGQGRLIERGGTTWQTVLHVLASFSPLQAMLSLVWQNSAYAKGAETMPAFWQTYIILSCGAIMVIAAICLYKLHRPVAPPRPREKLKVIERGKISARTFLFIVDPRKRKRMIRWWQNPVAIKEFRSRPMLQAQWLLRAVGICLICSVVLAILVAISVSALVSESGGTIRTVAGAISALMVTLIILIGPATASGAISADRETGVWDLMRTTRLPSWRILSGKFQASVIPLLLLAAATAPALLILQYVAREVGLNLWPGIIKVFCIVGMTILFVSTAGMLFSSFFSRTSTATAWTYALVVTMGLATLLVLLRKEHLSERFIEMVFLTNPIAAAMDAAGNEAMQKYDLVFRHLKIMGIATATMFVVASVRVFQLRRAD